MMKSIAVVDFGGQYTHLIANRIRRLGVYSIIVQPEKFDPEGWDNEIAGIVLSGGPCSVTEPGHPDISFDLNGSPVPVLGLCYGHQLIAHRLGGRVAAGGGTREYGLTTAVCDTSSTLFQNLCPEQKVWMSHGDHVSGAPPGFRVTAWSDRLDIAGFESHDARIFGLQFHPEVTHTENGMYMLDRFVSVCTDERAWKPESYVNRLIEGIAEAAAGKKLLLLVSGGVDSLVSLALCIRAAPPENVISIHVDTGLMRENESAEIMREFRTLGYTNIHLIEAQDKFLDALENVSDPEKKRVIIGNLFIDIVKEKLEELALCDNWLLVQGTIYPDRIESGVTSKSDKIKTHHNRVIEIQELLKKGRILEPLKELYKDEVRELGRTLGLPGFLVDRHPFPGPGLAIRTLCSDSGKIKESLEPLKRQVSEIARSLELSGTVLPVKSVGVQGDLRTYAFPAVVSFANDSRRDWETLKRCASLLVNNLQSLNRVVFSMVPLIGIQLEKSFITRERLDQLRKVDNIVQDMTSHLRDIWQLPVISLPVVDSSGKAVFVMRPVSSENAMTAEAYPLSFELIDRIQKKVWEVDNAGLLLLDLTSKPPGTIEWE